MIGLMPSLMPFRPLGWSLVLDSTGENYPTGLRDHDIGILLHVQYNSDQTMEAGPAAPWTPMVQVTGSTAPSVSSDENPIGSGSSFRRGVYWRSLLASTSGAIGGVASARRLLVFRCNRQLTGAATIVPIGAADSNLNRVFTAGYGVEPNPITPIYAYCLGSTSLPTLSMDAVPQTALRVVNSLSAGIFVRESGRNADIAMNWASTSDGGVGRTHAAFNLRTP